MAKKKKKPSGGKAAGKGGSTMSIGIVAAVVILVGLVAGVMGWVLTRDDGGSSSGSSGVKFPDFVYDKTAPKGTVEAYEFAVANQDVLKYIPCYCGCGELDGHDSNLDCFIKSGSGDNLVFDDHATG